MTVAGRSVGLGAAWSLAEAKLEKSNSSPNSAE
jgi:hypothetical protein